MATNNKTYNVKLATEIEPWDILITHCGIDMNSCKKTINPPIVNYSIFCLIGGSGIYNLNNKNFPISKNYVCLIPSGMEYTTIPDKNGPIQHYVIGFTGRSARYYLEKAGFSINNPVIYVESNTIRNKFETIYKLLSKNTLSSTIKANMVFLDIFYYFIQKEEKLNPAKVLQKNDYVQNVINYIKNNYMYDIKINKMAEQMHVNRSYLSHLFAETKGVSIKAYLTEYRMTIAKKLLYETNKSISEISTLSGFPDTVSFYRQFKKSTAISPQQYKTNLKIDPRFRTIQKY